MNWKKIVTHGSADRDCAEGDCLNQLSVTSDEQIKIKTYYIC